MNTLSRLFWCSLGISSALAMKSMAADPSVPASTSTTAEFNELSDYALSYKDAAQAGNAEAQYNLGAAFRWGVGVTQDLDQAVHWIRQSAEKGYAPAELALGSFFEKGEGVAADDEEALRWYKKAAAQGDVEAQKALAALKAKKLP